MTGSMVDFRHDGPPPAAARAEALQRLAEHAFAGPFDDAIEQGEFEFWSGALERLSASDRARVDALEAVQLARANYLMIDREVEQGAGAIVDRFLAEADRALAPEARRFLRRLAQTRLSVWEVRERGDDALLLRDLWRGGEKRVALDASLYRWDVVVARVTSWSGERHELEGDSWVFPPDAGPPLLAALRKRRAEAKELDDEGFLRLLAPLVNPVWLTQVAFRSPAAVQNTDGEELVLVELRYPARDVGRIAVALDGHAEIRRDVERDPDRRWIHVSARPDGRRVYVARFAVEDDELVVSVNSRERESKVRALLAQLVPDLGEPRVERGDPREAADAARRAAGSPRTRTDAATVRAYLDRHYRAWLDTPIPALGGLTPRNAAQKKKARVTLVALLKSLERGEVERRQCAGEVYDVAWIWRELGLEG